ncbi:ABC transporter substrate-binding protein [Desulfitobacterium hafniense]|nr:ABC transporter substrate-binding protein [Desulfitobacterium hafniense]EHL08459.1 periplasmic binding protein [Desulfitobacterium hafniense DP7]
MKKLRGLMVSVSIALLLVVLMGCAGTPTENSGAGAPEAGSGDAVANQAWPRTIIDAAGHEVTLEKAPSRIVVVHFSDMEYMLALNAPLIGAGFAESRIAMWDTLEPYRGKGIVDIGSSAAPSLEKILELDPDLIIGNISFNADIYDELRKIAPTVNLGGYATWEDRLKATAGVIGKEAEAAEYQEKTHQLLADSRGKLSSYSEQTFASLRITSSEQKTIELLGSKELGAYYSSERGLGLKAPDQYPETWQSATMEGIAVMDPDYILLHADSKAAYDQFTQWGSQQSVWSNLKAVKNGHIIYLNMSVWSGSPRAIELAAQNIVAGMVEN